VGSAFPKRGTNTTQGGLEGKDSGIEVQTSQGRRNECSEKKKRALKGERKNWFPEKHNKRRKDFERKKSS